jgi:hypothetical protein
MPEFHEGGCLCGAVRFQAQGRPLRVLACHCTLCQRVTGSAFSVEPVFLKHKVRFTGEPAHYEHRPPEHGRIMVFSFCGKCGNRIGLTLERFPQVQILYAGAFDDPTWLKPAAHIFTDSAVSWLKLPHDVNCFRRHMFEADGTGAKPTSPSP